MDDGAAGGRAFDDFFAAHYPRVREYAARAFGPGDADDIAQETMLRALRDFGRIGDGRPPDAWLRTVARRIAIDRRRKRTAVALDDATLAAVAPNLPDEPGDSAVHTDVRRRLGSALRGLNARDREVLALHEVHGVGIGELARDCGTTPGAVRQRLFRARHNLSRAYRDLGGSEYPALPAAARPGSRSWPVRLQRARLGVRRLSARPHQPGRGAVVAATVATVLLPITAPPRPVRPHPVTQSPVRPAPPAVPRPPDVAVPGVPPVAGPPSLTVGPVGEPASLPYGEDWEQGLAGWTVDGARATPECGVSFRGRCSLRLDPADAVTVTRPTGIPLAATVFGHVAVRRDPVAGRSTVAVDLVFDAGTVTFELASDDNAVRGILRSPGGSRAFPVAFSDPWQEFQLRLEPVAGVAAVMRLVAGRQRFEPEAQVSLPPGATRLAAIRVRAARLAGNGGSVWVDDLVLASSAACSDGLDNDGDGLVDSADPGCTGRDDSGESPDPECGDGIDNDGDGLVDYPADPSCAFRGSRSETTTCSNGLDDDGDGLVDYPADRDCTSASAESEIPLCRDGIDNEQDGATDYPADPGCTSPDDNSEWACTSAGADPATAGVCFDPLRRLVPMSLVSPGAQHIWGYVDRYMFALPTGPALVSCVVVVHDDGIDDPCARLGGTFVEHVAGLVRVDSEASARPGTGSWVCTATAFVLVRHNYVSPVPGRPPLAFTLCG